MPLLVVGSVAYDTVRTSAGLRKDALGGSATYFSIAASYFSTVGLVAVVGRDFANSDIDLLQSHEIEISGLEIRQGKTFRWSGEYGTEDINTRDTIDTQLNVFGEFSPKLSDLQRSSEYLFLANIDPSLQLNVLEQMSQRPNLVALDTMNFWIDGSLESLHRVVENVDLLFMDEAEIRGFTGEINLVSAARKVMETGPSVVVVKRGEHGVLLFQGDDVFSAPAFPLESVVDPTGAGDCFAGGFMGYLAATGNLSNTGFRRAAMVGTVMGSFAVESFSMDRVNLLGKNDIEKRFRTLSEIMAFEPLAEEESLPWRY